MLRPSISSAGRGKPSKSRRRQRWSFVLNSDLRTTWRAGVFYRVGHWPSRNREKRGLRRYARAMATFRAMGAGIRQPFYLALLAEACGKVGQAEEGLSALSEALTAGKQHWSALVRGGTVSAQGRANAQTVQSSEFQVRSHQFPAPSAQSPSGSRSVLSESHRNCPQPAGEVAGSCAQ